MHVYVVMVVLIISGETIKVDKMFNNIQKKLNNKKFLWQD
jgi:hypothetical protein